MRLGVTCRLHLLQNDRGLFHATAVTQAWNSTNKELAQKVNSDEENSPATPAMTQTHNLSITSPALYQQAIPAGPE